MNGENAPAEQKTANIPSIFKNTNKKKCVNYRDVTVILTIARIHGKNKSQQTGFSAVNHF